MKSPRLWLTAFALLLSFARADAMTFSVRDADLRPIEDVYYVFGDGEIREGDSERFRRAIAAVPAQARIELFLNSPGGSVREGLRLGRLVADGAGQGNRINTSVGREGSKPLTPNPGECSSSCVFVYLGGGYRYLKEESKIGVHQFAFADKSVASGVAVAASQLLAADIVAFIKETRADVELFGLMTSTLPEEINYVPHSRLRALRVVTDTIWDESWTFELVEGVPYLKIWQQSAFGENKLLLFCSTGKVTGWAFVEPPEVNMLGRMPHTVGIFIDGKLQTIPDGLVLQKPQRREKFANSLFLISDGMAKQMLGATSIGAGVQPPNRDIFFGFQINVAKGRDKLEKIINGCIPRDRR